MARISNREYIFLNNYQEQCIPASAQNDSDTQEVNQELQQEGYNPFDVYCDMHNKLYGQNISEETKLDVEAFNKVISGEIATDDALVLNVIQAAMIDEEKDSVSQSELDALYNVYFSETETTLNTIQNSIENPYELLAQYYLKKDLKDCTDEEINQIYTLNLIKQILASSQENLKNQDNLDGLISETWDFGKEKTGLGTCQKDVEKELAKQEEIVKKLEQALIDGDFNKKYLDLTDVEFDIDKITEQQEKLSEIQFVQMGLEKVNAFCKDLESVWGDNEATYNKFIEFYGEEKGKEEFCEMLKYAYNNTLNGFNTEINPIISISFNEEGCLVFKQQTGTEFEFGKIEDINPDILLATSSDKFKNLKINNFIQELEKTTGINYQKTLEEYDRLTKEALGNTNKTTEILTEYIKSQESFIDACAIGAQWTGMGLMALGSIALYCGCPAGAGIMNAGNWLAIGGMFGDNIAEGIDLATNNNFIKGDEEYYKGLLKETLTDAALFYSGYKINGISSQFDSLIAEIGVDASLSLLTDLIITGEIDLAGEGISQLLGIFTGRARAKLDNMKANTNTDTKTNFIDPMTTGQYTLMPDGSYKYNGDVKVETSSASAELAKITNADGSPRFNATSITKDFINFYTAHKDSLERALNIKDANGKYIIDETNIKELLETYAKYPNELTAILDLVNTQGENIVRDLPSIQRLAKYMHEEPQLEISRFLMHLRRITNLENNPLEFEIIMLQNNDGYNIKAKRNISNENKTYDCNMKEISRSGSLVTYELEKCLDTNTDAIQQVITLLEDGNITGSTGTLSENYSLTSICEEIRHEPGSVLDLLDIDYLDCEDLNIPKLKNQKHSSVKNFEEHHYHGNSSIISKISDDIVKYQIEIVNDADGQPSHILYTRSSNILDGAYDTTRYVLTNYPEDFDILTAIKNGTIDEVIKENGYAEGTKLSSVTQVGNITRYNESHERNGSQINRNYSQEIDDGGHIISTNYTYDITGANGEMLASINRSWKQNPDGTTTTIINGKEYQAKFNDETLEIEITQPDGNSIKFSILDKFGKTEKAPSGAAPNSEKQLKELIKTTLDNYGTEENARLALYEFLKTVPADQLINYNNHIDATYILPLINSACIHTNEYPDLTFLTIGEDIPIFAHELGHAIDGKEFKISSKNQELINIYNQEMLQFKKDYPELSQKIIKYFSQNGGSAGDGLSELFAETNMLLTTYGHNTQRIQTRAEYLVRYFPKTVAQIAKILGYSD